MDTLLVTNILLIIIAVILFFGPWIGPGVRRP
jgi:hypothetical protein